MAASKLKNCDSSVESIAAAIREDAAENIEYDYLGSALVKIKSGHQDHFNTSAKLEILHKYSSALPGTSPHAYRLAEELRRWALDQKSSRLVMFRGMSGSGKSEAYRSMLQHFLYTDVMQTTISGIAEERDPSKPLGFYANPAIISSEASATAKKLYASMCLLNVFSSAATEKNPWSSRVGQYTQLHFSSQGKILDAVTVPIFTEMLRCNPKDPNVGPLFIQHLLVHARGKPEYLLLNSSFRDIYTHHREIAYDSELFHLHDVLVHWGGMHEEQWEGLLKVVASVVHLQSINILGSETTMISANTKNHVSIAEQLLGLEAGTLLACIMKKVDDRPSRPAGSTMECRPHESKIILELLCNELMVRTLTSCLDYLRTNHAANMATFFDGKAPQDGSLHLFDPPGWERYLPQTPGNFYQFLNHYVEEKYNTFAIQEQFLGELYAYQDEGIQLDFVQQPNISQFVELLELSPGGLIGILEDACGAQKPDDKAFADKAIMNFGRVKLVRAGGAKTKPTTFVVRHSFAEAAYDCDGFIFCNKLSEPSPTILNTLKASTIPFLQSAAHFGPLLNAAPAPPPPEEGKANRLTKAKITLLYTKFLQMTDKLLAYLASCEKKNFVLCVNASAAVDEAVLGGQIQSLLIPNLVELSRFGYGYRLQFVEFFQRYRILAKFEHATLPIGLSPSLMHDVHRMRSYSQALMDEVVALVAQLEMTDLDLSQGSAGLAVYGKTCIFVKDSFGELMERARFTFFERYTSAAVRLQALVRMTFFARRFAVVRRGVIALQSHARRRGQQQRYAVLFNAAWRIRNWLLCQRQSRKYQRMRTAVSLIKSKLLGKMVQRIRYQRLIRAARNFQFLARGSLLRRQALNVFDAVVLLQRTFRALLTRRRRRRQRQTAILRIQRVFRGHRARAKLGNLVQILKIRREQRVAHSVVQKIQSIWRGKLVIARFQEIVAATVVLQRWFKACVHYRRFRKVRSLAIWLQSQARRLSAAKRTNAIKVGNMVREEKGTLASLYLQEIAIIRHPKHTVLTRGFTNHGRDRFARDLLVYDIAFDLSIAYPDGWLPTILSFAQELRLKENRLIEQLVVGAQHTVLVDDFHQVYTMGLGDLGQLGHNSRKSHAAPKKIEQIQRFITQGETLAKVSAGTQSASKLPTNVVPRMAIQAIACGQDHTLLLTQTKKVFSWGDNRRGQLGHSHFEVSTVPRLVTYTHSVNQQQVPLQNVRSVFCGKYHSACLADNGFAYVWGSGEVCMGVDRNVALDSLTTGDLAQLDLFAVIDAHYRDVTCRYDPAGVAGSGPRQVIDFCEPRPVSVLSKRKIFTLVSGEMHVAVVANDGVYAWGCNAYGQLGLGHARDTFTVSRLSFAAHHSGASAATSAAAKAAAGTSTAGRAASASASASAPAEAKEFTERDLAQAELLSGGRHMFLRTKSGSLWGWGWNKYGQVGDGSVDNVLRPVRVAIRDADGGGAGGGRGGAAAVSPLTTTNLLHLSAKDAAGRDHAAAGAPPSLPTLALALGWRSTVAITKQGRVYGWGIMSSLAAAVEINAARDASDVPLDDPAAVFLVPTRLPIECSAAQVAALGHKHSCGRGLHTASGFALSLFMLDRVAEREAPGASADDDAASVAPTLTTTSSLSQSVGGVAPSKALVVGAARGKAADGVAESKRGAAKAADDAKKTQRRTVKLDILRAAKALQERREREASARYDTKTGGQKNNTKSADEVLQRFRLEVGRLSLYPASTTANKRSAAADAPQGQPAPPLSLQAAGASSGKVSPRVGGGGAAMRSLALMASGGYARGNSPGRTFTARVGGGFSSPGRMELHDLQADDRSERLAPSQTPQADEERQRVLSAEQARLEAPGALLDLFSPLHYSKIKQRRQERGSYQPPPGVGMHVSALVAGSGLSGGTDDFAHIGYSQSAGHLLRTHSSPPRFTHSLASASSSQPPYAAMASAPPAASLASASTGHLGRSPLLYLNQRHASPAVSATQHAASPDGSPPPPPPPPQQRLVAYEVPIVAAPSKDASPLHVPLASQTQRSAGFARLPVATQRSDMVFLQSFLQKAATSTTARSLQRKPQPQSAGHKALSIDPNAPPLVAAASIATRPSAPSAAAATAPPPPSSSTSPVTRRLSALTTPLQASTLTHATLHQLSVGGEGRAGGVGVGGLLGVSGGGDPGEFRRQMQELGYLKRLDKPRPTTPTGTRAAR